MKTEYVKIEDAVGMIIPHDITAIKAKNFKGVYFKKGHLISEEDIPQLLDLGKEYIYSLKLENGDVHEDKAGCRIAYAAAGENISLTGPNEGKIDMWAEIKGLLKINIKALNRINSLPEVIISTLHNNSPVKAKTKVAGTRVIPLVAENKILAQVDKICKEEGAIVDVKPFKESKVGLVITGKEVYEGRIEDAFLPVLKEKILNYQQLPPTVVYSPDDFRQISTKISEMIDEGMDMVVVTGGMSVDPDDVSPRGIKESGAEIVNYGAPVLPGAMFLLAYYDSVPIIGLPACGMFYKTTVFDLIFPRLLAGERVASEEIATLGHGGLCRGCNNCIFPNCSFGKERI